MSKLGELSEKNRKALHESKFKTRPRYSGAAKKGTIKKTDAQYLVARMRGMKRADAVEATDLVVTGSSIRRANAIEKRMSDPNSALNRAFDDRGISADVLVGYAIAMLNAENVVKKKVNGEEVLVKVPDNRTRLAALELVVKLRNMMVAKQDKGDGDTHIKFEQNIIMATEILQDPEAMRKLLGKAKTITAEYTQIEK